MKFNFLKHKFILITTIVLSMSFLTSCSQADSNSGTKITDMANAALTGTDNKEEASTTDDKSDVMDFNKSLNLKKPASPVSKTPSVLFLGNSFTYVNDLPTVFKELSNAGGYSPEIADLTEGAYRLELFADKNDELGSQVYDALNNRTWDYVILQEQSLIPAVAPNLMYTPARTLDRLIKSANGQTVFFMTWAYKNGQDLNEYGVNKDASREEMQTLLADSYISISKELDSLLSPAGIAFMRCAEKYPEIELWDTEDLMHPSLAGTYLAACTLYGTLYNESPVGLTYTASLDSATAQKLQEIADGVVFK